MKLQNITEARYSAPPVEVKKLEKLLDAVAASVAFIGYESGGAHLIADQVEQAFEEAIGIPWHEWKKR